MAASPGQADAGTQRAGGVLFPAGRSLPREAWERRHKGVLLLLAAHAVGLTAFGVWMGKGLAHALLEGGIVAALALAAALPQMGRRARSIAASAGLMTSSGVLVHLSGGTIEAHFHFFVMLGIIFLYEDWLPYVLSVAYVAVHHGVVGTLDPLSVYNHPSAIAHPWAWAGIHATFILGLSVALILAWNVIERARRAEARATAEVLETKRQLHSQEKMAALGSLVSGLAHEVRTPLTIASTSASLLELEARRRPDDALSPHVLAQVEEIQASVDRINALVLQLRKFHAIAPDELRSVPLDALVGEAVRLFSSANRSVRRVDADLAPTPPVRAHVLGVHQIVLNLLSNAVEATDPTSGEIRVRTRVEGDEAVLAVEDNGVGMDAQTRLKAFEPLFTTKKDGMGLGLHIVRRIADAHGARVACASEEGRGTRVEVRFRLAPRAKEVPVETTAPAHAPAPAPR